MPRINALVWGRDNSDDGKWHMVKCTKIMVHFSDHFKSAFAAQICFVHTCYVPMFLLKTEYCNKCCSCLLVKTLIHEYMFWTRFRTLPSLPFTPSFPHATFLSLKSMYSDFHWFYLVLFVYAKIQEQLLEHLYPLTGLIFEINRLPFPRQPSFANIS